MSARPMEFRPAPAPLRDWWAVLLFGMISLGGLRAVILQPGPGSWLLLGVGLLFVVLVLWIELRLKVPGAPRLSVDAEGMAYRRYGRETRLHWDKVARIEVHHPRQEFRFVPASGAAPIVMHRDMVSADGQRFDMLIEKYWRAPRAKR